MGALLFGRVPLVLFDIPVLLFLFFYLWKWKAYSAKKASIFIVFAFLLTALNDYLAISIIAHIIAPLIPTFPLPVVVLFFPMLVVFCILSAVLLVKFSKNLRKHVNQNTYLQTILLIVLLFLFASFQVSIFVMGRIGEQMNTLVLTNLIFFVLYLLIALFIFIFYRKALETRLKAQYELKQKEAEQESLERYTNDLEQQQTAVRRFRHDYQNILSSMSIFFQEKDYIGLEQYFTSKVKSASAVMMQDDFILESLSKIKVREVKSILAAKLMMAQSMDISTTFQAEGEIDHIPMDTVTLVRMLGIILDNAIEALAYLGEGRLSASCLKTGGGVTIIVQNDCSADVPNLRQLKQDGFSTKGEGRGQGLNILSELANTCPNVTLSTRIEDGKFTQMLVIGGEG